MADQNHPTFCSKRPVLRASSFLGILILWATLFIPAPIQSQSARPANCLGGTLNAPVLMEIFSDFQCPTCRVLYLDTVTRVLAEYSPKDKVCVIYHEFPLRMHAYGREATRYSLAAQRLGHKQWLAVLDALYLKQPQWSLDGKIEAAIKDSVSAEDLVKIKRLTKDPDIEKAINDDIAQGEKLQVDSTPTVFLTAGKKTQKVVGALSYPIWKNFFDGATK